MKHLVFFTEHLSFGGAERALVEYLSLIDKTKYKVSLILRDDLGAANYLLQFIPKDVQVKIIYPKDDAPKGVLSSLMVRFCKKLDLTLRIKRALKELGPCDVLLDFTSVLIKQAHYFPSYKKVYWIHGPKDHMGPAELRKFSLRLRSYDYIVVVSNYLKEELASLLPHLQKKLVHIYNPFDLSRIRSEGQDRSDLTREELGLMSKPYILSVGRFAVEKDYETLIDAYKLLKSKGVDFKLYIIGDGPGRPAIEEKIRKDGLLEDVILLGAKHNPYVWMKNSLMFVHSAKIEGFGLVIVESMVLGKAVVATDSPVGPGEILGRGKYGVLKSVGDSVGLAEAIFELTQDSKKRATLEQISLERAKHFGAENVMPGFNDLIEKIATEESH